MFYPQALWARFHKACEAKAFGYKEDNNYLAHPDFSVADLHRPA